MSKRRAQGVDLVGVHHPEYDHVLTPEALEFVAGLQRAFNPRREALLARRAEVQRDIQRGVQPDFLTATADIRAGDWRVAPAPDDLNDRRVEITGPVDARMVINALNSGAKVFMADFEDATAPTWDNLVRGQANLMEAVRRRLAFHTPEGRQYHLNTTTATLVVRPRGWHLPEKHVLVDGQPMSGSLFDFGMYFFHNARELLARGSGPYFYLPKLESHLEARLWNDVFVHAQRMLHVPHGSIRATVLIETILAAFEMDEILYELRDHAAGLNAGRWDYMFSMVKKFRTDPHKVLPDRAQITMTVPFMRAYTELLVKTCHRRGAHAVGGMAAFIPSRKDPAVNEVAIPKVREDKLRESRDGFDGTWVAHPDLVPTARGVFDSVLGVRPHQKERLREEVYVTAAHLLDDHIAGGRITEAGVRLNINVALQYLDHWLRGIGAVALHNLMEDAATAEISRSQLWQWIRNRAELDDGRVVTRGLYAELRDQEIQGLGGAGQGRLAEAVELLDELVLGETFAEFLTLPAYERIVTLA